MWLSSDSAWAVTGGLGVGTGLHIVRNILDVTVIRLRVVRHRGLGVGTGLHTLGKILFLKMWLSSDTAWVVPEDSGWE